MLEYVLASYMHTCILALKLIAYACTLACTLADYVTSSVFSGYPAMSFYMNQTGRPMLFSCSWPAYVVFNGKIVSIPISQTSSYELVFPTVLMFDRSDQYFPRRESVCPMVLNE